MKTIERAAARFEVKDLNESARTFRGLASTWEQDLGGDVIHRGAYKKTLREWKASGRVMPLIDQHNYGSIRSVVGKMTDAEETAEGLDTGWSVIDGPDGDEILRRVKGGFIDSMSIGYEAVKWDMEAEDGKPSWEAIRHLKEVKLYEVSLVIWPMNPGATIDPASLKGLMKALAEGTLSDEQKQAIQALPSQAKDQFRALLTEEPAAGEAATQEDEGAAHFEQMDGLKFRIQMLNLRRAVA